MNGYQGRAAIPRRIAIHSARVAILSTVGLRGGSGPQAEAGAGSMANRRCDIRARGDFMRGEGGRDSLLRTDLDCDFVQAST